MNVERPVEKKKLKRKDYEKKLRDLQVELCHLQAWVKSAGARIDYSFRGARRRRQGWNHPGHDGKGEPPRLQGCGAACSVGP